MSKSEKFILKLCKMVRNLVLLLPQTNVSKKIAGTNGMIKNKIFFTLALPNFVMFSLCEANYNVTKLRICRNVMCNHFFNNLIICREIFNLH